jgi:lysophospholipase L1-like esterase
MLLKTNDHVLFYGDSITDCGQGEGINQGLGWGYAAMAAGTLMARHPELNIRCSNKGLSGYRVFDLERRLEELVLTIKPTVVSILIGINDTWRRYDQNIISEVPAFEDCYRRILSTIRRELSARLVICEPFLLPIPADRAAWREDLDPRIAAVRRVAMDYGATYVPLDGIFAAAACRREMEYWAPDGVHPTAAGHGLIAQAWLAAVGA